MFASQFTTGINDTGGKFSKRFETALMVYSGAGGKLIHEKKPEVENLVTLSATICPEKSNSLVYTADNGSKNLKLWYLSDGEACEAVVVQRSVVGLEEKRLVVQEPLHLTTHKDRCHFVLIFDTVPSHQVRSA
jgi:hypothetical protein